MKKLNSRIYRVCSIVWLIPVFLLVSCDLEEEVFIDIASNNFFQNDEDAITAVDAIYVKMRSDGSVTGQSGQQQGWGGFGYGEATIFNYQQVQTDELFVQWANFNVFSNFTLTPSSYGNFGSVFGDLFEGIFIANNVLANVEGNENISDEIKNRVIGEARFGRALFYSAAFSLYGNLPLIDSPEADPLALPSQVAPSEIADLIVEDFSAAAYLLPDSYAAEDYGRFTRGAALAQLARFQLNQRNWSEAIEAAREVMSMGYSLSPTYSDIFSINNANNPEIILAISCIAQPGIGNTMVAHSAQADFAIGSWGGHQARNSFYDSFDPADIRRNHLIRDYINSNEEAVSLTSGAMILKYELDPDRVGPWAGNDIVLHRLGELYLTLAEALNEVNGPNQESVDLINALRDRAFGDDPSKRVQLSDFANTEELRDRILAERSWELFAENYRRDDLIRHGKYIQFAQERGVDNAQPFHVLYPIPQFEIDRNPNLIQNEGY